MNESNHDLETLRAILLAQDRETLKALQEEVERLKAKIDNPEEFLRVIEPVISKALAHRSQTHPEEVAEALSPVIVDAIQRQIRENRDAFVAALVPIMGPLITRTVQEAFQALARRVDEQIRKATSLRLILKRWWARLRGIPPEEVLVREALPWTSIGVLVIDNESGLILVQAYKPGEAFGRDPDLTAGLLTAIRNFARETFSSQNGSPMGTLYELRVDSYTVLMEEGPGFYVAWVGIGIPPMDASQRLQELITFVQTSSSLGLAKKQADEPSAFLLEYLEMEFLKDEELPPPTPEEQGVPKIGMALATMGLIAILFLCGWGTYRLSPRVLAHILPTAIAYLTPTPTPSSQTPGPTTAVLTQTVILRSAPGAHSTPIGTPLPEGEEVRILAETPEGWVQIGYPAFGQPRLVGWVPRSALHMGPP